MTYIGGVNPVTGALLPAIESRIATLVSLASVATAKTSAYTLTQSDSGFIIPVNSSSSVAITAPSLAVGTTVGLIRQGTGAVTFTASGVTFLIPTGSTAAIRVQGASASLLWLTTTLVHVSGDLA